MIKSFTYSVNIDNIKNIADEIKNNISSLFKSISLIYLKSVDKGIIRHFIPE